jgi:hypothetical protein
MSKSYVDNLVSSSTSGIMQSDLEALETSISNEITRTTNAELSIIDRLSTTTYNSGEIIKQMLFINLVLALLIIISAQRIHGSFIVNVVIMQMVVIYYM